MLWETTFQYYTNGEFQNTRRLADESDSQRSCPEDRSLPRMSHLLQKEPLVFIFGPLAVHVCLQSKSVAEGDVALRKYHCMANVHFVLPASIRTVYHGAPFTLRKTPDGRRAHLQMNLGAPKVQSFSQVHTQSVPRLASPTGLLPTHVFLPNPPAGLSPMFYVLRSSHYLGLFFFSFILSLEFHISLHQ